MILQHSVFFNLCCENEFLSIGFSIEMNLIFNRRVKLRCLVPIKNKHGHHVQLWTRRAKWFRVFLNIGSEFRGIKWTWQVILSADTLAQKLRCKVRIRLTIWFGDNQLPNLLVLGTTMMASASTERKKQFTSTSCVYLYKVVLIYYMFTQKENKLSISHIIRRASSCFCFRYTGEEQWRDEVLKQSENGTKQSKAPPRLCL